MGPLANDWATGHFFGNPGFLDDAQK